MPPKRKIVNDVSPSSKVEVRRTRSSRATELTDSPRKRRRAAKSADEDPFAELPIPSKPTRTYKGVKRSRKADSSTDSAVTSPSAEDLSHTRAASVASDTTSAKRLVLDSVELPAPKRRGKPGRPKKLERLPSSQHGDGLILKKSTTRSKPGPRTPEVVEAEAPATVTVDEPLLASPSLPINQPVYQAPITLPKTLSQHQIRLLQVQKQAILRKFADPPFESEEVNITLSDEVLPNQVAKQQLEDILSGSIERSEGNSCLVLGPSGSGKSKLVEQVIQIYRDEHKPIVIRLNGYVQHTDRLALREIARQVVEQTGNKTFQNLEDDDDNPFDEDIGILPPPPSHLPSLIGALPSLSRPVVVLLDAFNIFTEQPRQALLYCLLDTVQSCRASNPAQKGLAVIGITTRLDVVNFLEKRVKSRFSHRILRTGNARKVDSWLDILGKCLKAVPAVSEDAQAYQWLAIWNRSVEIFLKEEALLEGIQHMFGVSRDIRGLFQVMTRAVLSLTPHSPFLDSRKFDEGLASQHGRSRRDALMKLDYPRLSLLIAATHARTAGHEIFSFEMLHELFSIQVRTSSVAPVTVGGGSIGMTNAGRRVMMAAFETLISMKVFLQASSSSANSPKEFIKYRCCVEHEDVKSVVNQIGQTSLKKWFNKAQ